jgi:hypothetical protein
MAFQTPAYNDARNCRSASRVYYGGPDDRFNGLGFRVVLAQVGHEQNANGRNADWCAATTERLAIGSRLKRPGGKRG